jgi:hypothetical protein
MADKPATTTLDYSGSHQTVGDSILYYLNKYLVWRIPALLFCLWVYLRWQDIPVPYFPKFNRDFLVIPVIAAELIHILRRDKISVLFFPVYTVFYPLSFIFFVLYDISKILLIPIRLFVIMKAENIPFTFASSSASFSGWSRPSAGISIPEGCSRWGRMCSPTWCSCMLSSG